MPGYGAPAGYAPGAQPGAMMPYGQGAAGAIAGTLSSAGAAGAKGPTRRNALMVLLLPLAVIFGGQILCGILVAITGSVIFSLLSLVFTLGGAVWALSMIIPMVNELKSVTQNAELAWWPMFVPFYNYYWMWLVIPAEVAKAKQMLGVQQPPRHIVLYIFLWPFALASDINDMVR
jgi:hypothetical protein